MGTPLRAVEDTPAESCPRPGCVRTLPPRSGPGTPGGRPRIYCSAACAKAVARARRVERRQERDSALVERSARLGAELALSGVQAALVALVDILRQPSAVNGSMAQSAAQDALAAVTSAVTQSPSPGSVRAVDGWGSDIDVSLLGAWPAVAAADAPPGGLPACLASTWAAIPEVRRDDVIAAAQWVAEGQAPAFWVNRVADRRPMNESTLGQLLAEWRNPELLQPLSEVVAGLSETVVAHTHRPHSLTASSRARLMELLMCGTWEPDEVVQACVWSATDPYWRALYVGEGRRSGKKAPAVDRTPRFATIFEQWNKRGRPRVWTSDSGVAASARRLAQRWSDLQEVEGDFPPGWVDQATVALTGDDNSLALAADQVDRCLTFLVSIDGRKVYNSTDFPPLRVLNRISPRIRARAPAGGESGEIAAAVDRLVAQWAEAAHAHTVPERWSATAREALAGSSEHTALTEEQVSRALVLVRDPEFAPFYGTRDFPPLRTLNAVLARAIGRTRRIDGVGELDPATAAAVRSGDFTGSVPVEIGQSEDRPGKPWEQT